MPESPDSVATPRVLVVGCGALARELVDLTRNLPNVDISCLPATLHNRPGGIPAAVRERVRRRRGGYDRVFVAYADCGTGGLLDRMLEEEGIDRLPGAHCYEFYAGRPNFAQLTEVEPAIFFLTDFLARNFERLVWRGLGLDRHPELLPQYFGNYRRLVYLSQRDDPELVAAARRTARRLGLAFEHRRTGYGELGTSILAVAAGDSRPTSTSAPVLPVSARIPRPTSKPARAARRTNRSDAKPAVRASCARPTRIGRQVPAPALAASAGSR